MVILIQLCSSFPRLRTVLCVGCLLLVCTFYWDLIVLQHLHSRLRNSPASHSRESASSGWSWECITRKDEAPRCVRGRPDRYSTSLTLKTCSMTCTPVWNLWPLPTGQLKINRTTASFHPRQLNIDYSAVNNSKLSILLKDLTTLYQKRISNLAKRSHAHSTIEDVSVLVKVTKPNSDTKYKLNIDESYRLSVNQKGSKVQATVTASTFLGVHHGLETLTQLIWWDELEKVLKILNNVVITDAPIFTYRGLLLDTAKTFMPMSSIMRTLDAMSMNKLNVFHWHMTDSQSFPFVSDKFPHFKEFGPYSIEESYSKDDIKRVVEYAELRGVLVLVEVDAPAHNSQGWDWGDDVDRGNLSLCVNAQPFLEFCSEPPCGQLNPSNNNSFFVLAQVLKELNGLANTDNLMHIGGDDVDFRCWESFGEVTDTDAYMSKGIIGVWEQFYQQLFSTLSSEQILPKNFIIWSNQLLDESNIWFQFNKAVPIVQCRGPSSSGELERLTKKFKVIVSSSDAWYLSDPQNWLTAYNHQPWEELSVAGRRRVLGGEACAWTDHLDLHTVDPWLWPAAAAVAERLWSDPPPGHAPTDRLARFRERMVQEGVSSSPVLPRWCLQNPSQCL